jgi:hypothetical protein
MQLRRNLRTAVARLAPPIDVRPKGWRIGPVVVPGDRTTEARRAGHAPSPLPRPRDWCAVLVPIAGHASHQHAPNLWSVLRGRCRCLPQGWTSLRQAQARLVFRRRQRQGLRASEPGRLCLQRLLVTERLCPLPLPRTGHQAIVRLDGCVRPGRPLGVSVRSLQALVPMGRSRRTFGTPGLLRGPTQRKRRRREHLHHLLGNTALQERPGPAEAAGHPVITGRPPTGGAHVMRLAAVGRPQAPPAPPTDEHPHQSGGACTGRTEGFRHGPVVGSALRERGTPLPAAVRWEAIGDQHVAGLRGVAGPPGPASPRLWLPRSNLARPPARGARLDRGVPQVW